MNKYLIENLFGIEGWNIAWYGVIIACGMLLGLALAVYRAKKEDIHSDVLYDFLLIAAPIAILCARAYYVIFEWESYADNPVKILAIWEGGLAIYGGVIGAAIGVAVFTQFKKINLPALLDLVALGFLIGQFIGRWGNFMNREAFGCYTDSIFAMQIPESYLGNGTGDAFTKLREMAVEVGGVSYIQVHPTFLYESLWNLVGFVALHFLSKKRQYDGQIALCYVAWYGLGRALIEGLRMDSLYWGPFRVSQLVAAASCVVAVVILMLMNLRKHDRSRLYVSYVNKMDAVEAAVEEVLRETEE